MSVNDTGDGGVVKPDAGTAPNSGSNVDADALASKVAELLKPQLSQEITGAVGRQVKSTAASMFDGIDLEALKGFKPAAPKADKDTGKGKGGDAAVQAELGTLKKQVEETAAQLNSWRAKALNATITNALDECGAHKDARDIVAPQIAGMVQEANGALFVVDNDVSTPLPEYVKAYLDARPGLKTSTARTGTGAGSPQNQFSEPMPASKSELMYSKDENDIDPMTGKRRLTPERVAAFKAAHPDAWDKLPA